MGGSHIGEAGRQPFQIPLEACIPMVLIRVLIDEVESVDRLELWLIFGRYCGWEKV